MRWVLRSKIHNATVTDADLDYAGSITIDEDLVEQAGLWVGEKVLVASSTSGSRLETYVIAGERGSGAIVINGAAAHRIKQGEQVTIMGFELAAEPVRPKVLLLGPENRIVRYLQD